MTKNATDKLLGSLHGHLAKSMLDALNNTQEAADLLDKYQYELPMEVTKFLSSVSAYNPALYQSVARFLKDNSITCAVEDSEELTDLQRLLQEKKNKRRVRIGNVVPIEE